jgi:opacity protein-like surface antigen
MQNKLFNYLSLTTLAFGLSMSNAHATGEGFYLGGAVGMTNTHNLPRDVQTGTTPATVRITPSNTGLGERLFLGYNINQYAAIESGYTHYAPSIYTNSSAISCSEPAIRENGVDLFGKGMLPLGSFKVFGKAGLAAVKSSASGSLDSQTILTPTCSGNSSSTISVRPAAGVGVSFDFSPNWQADLSWNRVFKGGKLQNADFYGVGVSYHFADRSCGQFLC